MTILAYAFAAIALLGMIGGGVYKVKQWGGNEVRAEWSAANEKARAEEAARSAAAAKELLAERAKRKVVIQERTVHVDREVEKLVYRSICIPDTGMCLLRAAISGQIEPGCLAIGDLPPSKPPG